MKVLKWETSEQTDLGFDVRSTGSRLGLNSIIISRRPRLAGTGPIIGTAGASAPYINGGDVTNKGVEVNYME